MKKKLVLFAAGLCLAVTMNAQTNTFPPSGKVGIGTTSPSYQLHIKDGNGLFIQASNAQLMMSDISSAMTFRMDNSGNLQLTNNAFTPLYHFDKTGKLGIGTTSPSYNLDVMGTLRIAGNSELLGASNKIYGNSDSNNFYIGHYAVSGSDGLDIHWYGGIRLGDHTGNVLQISNGNLSINGNTEIFGGSNKIYGNSDLNNYYIGHYAISGSDGLDIHWYGGIRLSDFSGTVLQVSNGNIGIGTTSPEFKLDVVGRIRAWGVKINTTKSADFVFEADYKLPPLSEVEAFIKVNKHLQGIQSATQMKKDGLDMGDFQINLLQKIEELTIYSIELKKENEAQKTALESQAKTSSDLQIQLLEMKKEIDKIKKLKN